VPQQATTTISTVGSTQLTNIRLDQISVTTMQTPRGVVNVVQIGPGNSFALSTAQLPAGVANVIQNSLDNQTLRQTTNLSVSANSLSLLRAATFGAALQRQLLSAVR
jgi:hypothetical protein